MRDWDDILYDLFIFTVLILILLVVVLGAALLIKSYMFGLPLLIWG